MQFGRSYEEFEVGATYKHWPGKTVTEYDDHLFCLLTMNHHPLHLDEHYAKETTQFGRNVVVGNYVYSLLLGSSIAVSRTAYTGRELARLRELGVAVALIGDDDLDHPDRVAASIAGAMGELDALRSARARGA